METSSVSMLGNADIRISSTSESNFSMTALHLLISLPRNQGKLSSTSRLAVGKLIPEYKFAY